MSVTTTPLVKGELDWHNKINDNTNLLQTEINNISDENVENSLAKQIKINKQEIDNMKNAEVENSLQQQINILKCPKTDLPNNSLLEYIKNLPSGVHRTIQFSGAVDVPTKDWYYAEIYTHSYGISYFRVNLYPLNTGSNISYYGICRSGFFEGWKQAYGKEPFNCTPVTGYTILKSDCFKMNGLMYIDISIKRTDDSVFPTGSFAVATSVVLPKTSPSLSVQTFSTSNISGMMNVGSSSQIAENTGKIYINVENNVKSVTLTGIVNMKE